MEVHHAGNVLPASGNNSCTCCIVANAGHEPIIKILQLLAVPDWFDILVVCVSAELLQAIQLVLLCAYSS